MHCKYYVWIFVFILFCSCSNIDNKIDDLQNTVIIKIISPYDCKYYFIFKHDSLFIKSESYSYNSITNKFDTVIGNQDIKLNQKENTYIKDVKQSLLSSEFKIENRSSQDLYKYELTINNRLVRKTYCCDDDVRAIIHTLVTPNIDAKKISCDQFFEMITQKGKHDR